MTEQSLQARSNDKRCRSYHWTHAAYTCTQYMQPEGRQKASCSQFLDIASHTNCSPLKLQPTIQFLQFGFCRLISLSHPPWRHRLLKNYKMIMSWIYIFTVSCLPFKWTKSRNHSVGKMWRLMDCLWCQREGKKRAWEQRNLPNDLRAIIFTSFFLNVLTLHGHHYKHIKPLWTLSKDFLMGLHIYEKHKYL